MQLDHAAKALESLGNEKRLTVFRTLVRAGRPGMPVGRLQAQVGIPASTLSHHLAQLVNCGLVSQTREGRVLRCTVNFGQMNDLVGFLVRECCRDESEDPSEDT